MRFTLKDYQLEAVRDALENLSKARRYWQTGSDRTAFSLTAVTGAGKTVMAAAVFEALFHGDDELDFDADKGAVVIWFSDDPSLNEQTRFRLMESSDRINYTDMVVVENTFNRPKFEAGKIYFLNTQKLSKKSLLVRGHESADDDQSLGMFPETRPDLRAYTIWDTIQNTIEDPDLTLYFVLDEAHRGVGKSSNERGTIVHRLINGFGSVPGIPVVWGISATVERFNKAIEIAVKRTKLPDVVVDSQKVQESGLIKDTILLDIPDEVGNFDTVLIRRAAEKLRGVTNLWDEYAQSQGAEAVVPLMVLQVPNTPDPNEIGRALDTIYATYPELPAGSVAHVFADHSTQQFGNRFVPYIEPQRVQDSTWVRVLVAKDAISTGWDCPRAEVMVSFRAASDKTHITQLLGRMVRSPLARRIPGSDRLNSVVCLLPKFNRTTVEGVVQALMTGDDSQAATPGRVLVNPVEMLPNPEVPDTVWARFTELPSQTRPQTAAKPAKRLTALSQELADDGLLEDAGAKAHAVLHHALDKFRLEHVEMVEAKRNSVLSVEGRTVVADLKVRTKTLNEFWEDADIDAIDDAYRRAARVFSPDVARTYVDYLASKVACSKTEPLEYLDALMEARVTVAGLGLVFEVQAYFDAVADQQARQWLVEYGNSIKTLSDSRREAYRQVIEMSSEPQDVSLMLPGAKFEPTMVRLGDTATPIPTWDSHLLCDGNRKYPAELNSWEQRVLDTELVRPGFLFWYRNPQQPGQASLGIAYQEACIYKILRPDFIIFAEENGELVVDIIDPHGLHLADALVKLQGIASYAKTHEGKYRRILSIAEVQGRLRALDMTCRKVQEAVLAAREPTDLFGSSVAVDYLD